MESPRGALKHAGGKLPRDLKVDGQNQFAIISESGAYCIRKSPPMSTHPVVSGETYREKALRKFKQQPLVPVGAPSLNVHIEAY
jgi:hypothetical protein